MHDLVVEEGCEDCQVGRDTDDDDHGVADQ